MVKLILQGQTYVCKDALAAAKIVDLMLATATPIDYVYEGDGRVQATNGNSGCFHYATKLTYQIVPIDSKQGEATIYESCDEARATVERIKAVLDETAAQEG